VEHVHDHIDLSQQPAKTVSDFGETATDVSGAVGPDNVADTSADCKGVSHASVASSGERVDGRTER
jgi:hypothetical protein